MPSSSLPLVLHHVVLLPSASTVQTLNPLAASAPRLSTPSKPPVLSLRPRPGVSTSSSFAVASAAANDDEDVVLGDCLVFEDEAFEDPDLDLSLPSRPPSRTPSRPRRKAALGGSGGLSLVPDRWSDAVEEINLTKKEKRRIAHGLRFGSRLDRRVPSAVAAPDEYRAYREGRLDAELGYVASEYVYPLDKSREYSEKRMDVELGHDAGDYVDPLEKSRQVRSGAKLGYAARGYEEPLEKSRAPVKVEAPPPPDPGTRVAPRNPRMSMDVGGLEDITQMFISSDYEPGEVEDGKNTRSRRKLFTDEEKVLMNKRLPDLEAATSSKWLPVHTLAASGDFYLLDNLLKHNVDINAIDKDGLSAIHKAILSKKHAIINYLLRNSTNPFIYDKDGATLMHYAVQTACNQTIKTLLLYNVDINRPDDYGWTPLHLAVQTQRTDIVKLLLIKGADRTLKTQDGLNPLELCLQLGQHARTYELIKLLKSFGLPKQRGSV